MQWHDLQRDTISDDTTSDANHDPPTPRAAGAAPTEIADPSEIAPDDPGDAVRRHAGRVDVLIVDAEGRSPTVAAYRTHVWADEAGQRYALVRHAALPLVRAHRATLEDLFGRLPAAEVDAFFDRDAMDSTTAADLDAWRAAAQAYADADDAADAADAARAAADAAAAAAADAPPRGARRPWTARTPAGRTPRPRSPPDAPAGGVARPLRGRPGHPRDRRARRRGRPPHAPARRDRPPPPPRRRRRLTGRARPPTHPFPSRVPFLETLPWPSAR